MNAFDGVMSNQTGVITILTTNHIEKLGDAFIRPGRVDARFELKECNKEQIYEMVLSFINKSWALFRESKKECLDNDEEQKKWDYVKDHNDEILQKIIDFSKAVTDKNGDSVFKPCEIQSYLLKHIDNLDNLFGNYDELFQSITYQNYLEKEKAKKEHIETEKAKKEFIEKVKSYESTDNATDNESTEEKKDNIKVVSF